MKHLLFALIVFTSFNINAQVVLKLGKYNSVIKNFENTTSEALQTASFILSSQEFKDSLLKYSFSCKNLSSQITGCESEFSGQRVYDSLIKYPDTSLNISIKTLSSFKRVFDKHDQIGFSKYGIFRITTNSWYLKKNRSAKVTARAYASHLAHEYCHIRGYYHRSQKIEKDVAYQVGKIVTDIIKRRIKNNEPIN